jgi:hypothetical protein
LNLRTGPSSPSAAFPTRCSWATWGGDGRIFPVSSSAAPRKPQEDELGLKERWYPIQVKQKDKAGRPDIDAFEAMMMREDCDKGFFVSFDYSSDALQEIESFFKRSHKVIVALTVQEILDEHIAKKLV